MYRVLLVDDEQIERMALAKKIDRYYGDKVDIYFAAITPFISGMDISIITISFFCSPHMATASLPFTA